MPDTKDKLREVLQAYMDPTGALIKAINEAKLIARQVALDEIRPIKDELASRLMTFESQTAQKLEDMHANLSNKIDKATDISPVEGLLTNITKLEGKPGKPGKTPTNEELRAIIKPLIPPPIPGKTPTDEELLALIKPLIPEVENGETPDDEDLLKLMIPLLEELRKEQEEKLSQAVSTLEEATKKVKDLEDKLVASEKKLTEARDIPRGKLGMRKVPIVQRVNLTDQVDGATKSFTLPKDTVKVLGVWGTQFPITFDEADFSLAGNTLTLTDEVGTPASGQTLVALVETLFYA